MKGRKILYLVVALIFPALIFLFLKFFGRNEFNVPPLYQQQVDLPASECPFSYQTPYAVPDSVMSQLLKYDSALLIALSFPIGNGTAEGIPRLWRRVAGTFAATPVSFIQMDSLESLFPNIELIRDCIFFVREPASVVLVDAQGRIRGHYDATSLDDMDRLVVELNGCSRVTGEGVAGARFNHEMP